MTILLGSSTLPSPSSVAYESSHCQLCQIACICCSMSSGVFTNWNKYLLYGRRRAHDLTNKSFRCRNPLFGAMQTHWCPGGRDICLSKLWISSDYSDKVPDSSSYMKNRGYHPLEEVKVSERSRETILTTAEIARTTVEANNKASMVFPAMVHCEPHGQVSWAEFQYYIDEYGDIFFEISDDQNILQDRWAVNPVNVLIGMDIPVPVGRKISDNYDDTPDISNGDDDPFHDENFELLDTEISDNQVNWQMPDNSDSVHPVYFAKCLTKAVESKYRKRMDHPSNGISILGCLTPALVEDEPYLRRRFYLDEDYGCLDGKAGPKGEEEQVTASHHLIGGEISDTDSKDDGPNISSTLYRLEIIRIELFSIYGVQSTINLGDFQEAEPDLLVHSASAILGRFAEMGMKCKAALKAFCQKKGHLVETWKRTRQISTCDRVFLGPLWMYNAILGADIIGVDSLGMDVRAFFGVQVQTLRFPFKTRATSENAAEKKIQRMLFPRYYRKKLKTQCDGLREELF